MTPMQRKWARAAILAMFVSVGGLLATSPTSYRVNFDALLDIWGDVIRDVDAVVHTVHISTEMEIEIGDDIARSMWLRTGPAQAQAYVSEVGQRVAKGARRQEIPWRFHVVSSGVTNAWAIPGGHVYITTAMLDLMNSEAELAAIIGHEIAHIDLNHCVNRVQNAAMLSKMGLDSIAFLLSLAEELVAVGYSEVQEVEADRMGMLLAAKAGYSPLAAFDTFRSFYDIYGDDRAQAAGRGGPEGEVLRSLERALEDYFGTHPPMLDRLDALRFLLEVNASRWEGETFYRGSSNHSDRIDRGSSERDEETWVFSEDALEYLIVRGALAHLLGREAEARRFSEKALNEFPDAPEVQQLIDRLSGTHAPETAGTGSESEPASSEKLRKRKPPRDTRLESRIRAADQALDAANLEQAAQLIRELRQSHPDDKRVRRLAARLEYERGEEFRKRGMLGSAIYAYGSAIEIDPEYARPYARRGRIYHTNRNYSAATLDYERALEIAPRYIYALYNFAWLLATAAPSEYRDGARAVALAEQAIAIKDKAGYRDTLAAALVEVGNQGRAVAEYLAAFSMDESYARRATAELQRLGCIFGNDDRPPMDQIEAALRICVHRGAKLFAASQD
jgi:predicted Zn-dependent protease